MSHLPTRNGAGAVGMPTVSLEELINAEQWEVLPSGAVLLAEPDLRELGSTGQTLYGSVGPTEYKTELLGVSGIRTYDKMRRSDATVRASIRILKTPILAARWFIEPASEKKKDQKIAKEVWDNLTISMSTSWFQLLDEILLCLSYGFYVFEKVFEVKDGKTVWKKMAPRHPSEILEWSFDDAGGLAGIKMWDGNKVVEIPISKLLVFTHDKEAGKPEGISVLRSAYKHWFYKDNLYKIDAIQKERHGIGIPIIRLPMGYNDTDRTLANEIGDNLRTNERAHVVLPPMWELAFLKLEGNMVDALASAKHHDDEIFRNVLWEFSGSKDDQKDMFLKSARFVADIIRDVFNKYAIPQIVDYNYSNVDEYPQLKVRRLGDTADWRTISFAVRNLIGAGVVKPDDRLEDWFREEMDLPKPDPETVRETKTPQLPTAPAKPQPGQQPLPQGNAKGGGMPGQTTAQPPKPPAGNAGQDRAGK